MWVVVNSLVLIKCALSRQWGGLWLGRWALLFALLQGQLGWSETLPVPAASMAEFCTTLPRPEYAGLQRIPSGDDWFETYRLAPGVTAIYEPHQWQEVISYLIEGTERALLFDTGNGIGDIAGVVRRLTALPVSVLNSHTHYDHVGGNFAFTTIYAMDTAFTRARQAGHDTRDIAVEVSPAALCRPLPVGVTPENHRGRPFQVSSFIVEGSVLQLGQRQLEVMQVPGHTPDSIVLIDREAGLMWTGDSFYEGPIWLHAPETDLAAYGASVAKLAAMVPDLQALLPAHNTPWVAPSALLDLQRAWLETQAGEAEALVQGDGLVQYRVPGISRFSFLLRADSLESAAASHQNR